MTGELCWPFPVRHSRFPLFLLPFFPFSFLFPFPFYSLFFSLFTFPYPLSSFIHFSRLFFPFFSPFPLSSFLSPPFPFPPFPHFPLSSFCSLFLSPFSLPLLSPPFSPLEIPDSLIFQDSLLQISAPHSCRNTPAFQLDPSPSNFPQPQSKQEKKNKKKKTRWVRLL